MCQGSAADIVKGAMVELVERLREEGLAQHCKLLLQVSMGWPSLQERCCCVLECAMLSMGRCCYPLCRFRTSHGQHIHEMVLLILWGFKTVMCKGVGVHVHL